MAIAKVFKNRVPNCKVFHPNGRQITFIGGKHITVLPIDIKYLESLVEEGDQFVYVDPAEAEIDTEELTPEGKMNKIKREAVAEFLAQQAAAANHESTSKQEALKPASSAELMKMTADSNSASAAPVASGGVKVTAPASK